MNIKTWLLTTAALVLAVVFLGGGPVFADGENYRWNPNTASSGSKIDAWGGRCEVDGQGGYTSEWIEGNSNTPCNNGNNKFTYTRTSSNCDTANKYTDELCYTHTFSIRKSATASADCQFYIIAKHVNKPNGAFGRDEGDLVNAEGGGLCTEFYNFFTTKNFAIANSNFQCSDGSNTTDWQTCPSAPPGDADHDGVTDDKDKCADTPSGTAVNADGCPTGNGAGGTPNGSSGAPDDDHDGVPNSSDQCPGTPAGTQVGGDGCPHTAPPEPAPPKAGIEDKDNNGGACPKGYIELSVSLGPDYWDDDADGQQNPNGGPEHVDCIGKGNETLQFNPIIVYLRFIVRVLSGLIGAVVASIMMIAGIMYVTSAGNPEKIVRAKRYLTNSVIALFLYIFAVALVNFVIPGGVL